MLQTLSTSTRCATLICALAAAQSASVAEEYNVYLLAGQSNMDGRGLTSELAKEQQKPIEQAIIFYRNTLRTSDGWRKLAPGFSVPPKYKGDLPSPTFGPEIGFALSMLQAKPNRKLALIKGSKGGTSLRVDWKPGKKDDKESQGPRYREFIATIHMATKSLRERGDRFTICGLLWHQGESDTRSSTEVYRLQLKKLIVRIREDIDVPDLPVVVGEVYDNGNRDTIRAAIQAVAAENATVGLVSAEGTKTSDPGTHFDARSQILLGERYSAAIRKLPLPKPRS